MNKKRVQSKAIYQKACQLIPGGVNSPVRAFKELGIDPIIVDKGKGALIEDVDGNTYIDYCCGWGALIHGHNPDFLIDAVKNQLNKGLSFGIATQIEMELASKVVSLVPSIEKVRFVSSGTESVMSAIRLARAATGKPAIVKFEGHYHGHSDSLLIKSGSGVSLLPEASSQGIPADLVKQTLCLPFNDFNACQALLRSRDDIAAVLLEPVTANMGVVLPKPGFLEMLREETEKNGSLLIFDEVVTGFRLGISGAQGLFGIDPDLTCLGKVLGGGFPAAAYGGPAHLMDRVAPLGNVYQAGTLSGFPLAMAAGLAAIEELEIPGFFGRLEKKTQRLVGPIQRAIEEHQLPASLCSMGSMITLFFSEPLMFREFFVHMLERGIYLPPSQMESWFVSSAHTDEQIDFTVQAVLEFFDKDILTAVRLISSSQ